MSEVAGLIEEAMRKCYEL